jgi:hypothetical protein
VATPIVRMFTIRGEGCRKRLILQQILAQIASVQYVTKTFNIGVNTLLLRNIELIGLESIGSSVIELPEGGLLVGAIALGGCTSVNVSTNTDTSFSIEGNDNTLKFLFSDLTMREFVLFSDLFESTLHFTFMLQDQISGNPLINFADDLMNVHSSGGFAKVVFDDYWTTVVNQGSNSFVTTDNAFISGKNVEINSFPIKQTSTDLILDSGLTLRSADLPNAIDTSFARSLRAAHRVSPVITALDIKRIKQVMGMDKVFEEKAKAEKQREKEHFLAHVKPVKPREKKAKKKQVAEALDPDLIEDRNVAAVKVKNQTRTFVVPTDPTFFNLTLNNRGTKLSDANGNIKVSGTSAQEAAQVTDFDISESAPLNLYLLGNATLFQGECDTTLKTGDTIFVDGLNNRIRISRKFTIMGQIIFNDNAQLIIEFDDKADNPEVALCSQDNQLLELEPSAQFEFSGNGNLWMQDGYVIMFNGTSVDDKPMFELTNSAHLKFSGAGDPYALGSSLNFFTGIGTIFVDHGGMFMVEGQQQVVVGTSVQAVGQAVTNNIDLIFDRNGILSIDAIAQDDETKQALMSLQNSQYQLNFQQGAELRIGKYGTLEVSMFNNVPQPGLLTDLVITTGAQFTLDFDGTFVLGRNVYDDAFKKEIPFNFNSLGGFLSGEGMVQLGQGAVPANKVFAGRIANFVFKPTTHTAQTLVRALINYVPAQTNGSGLKFATAFLSKDGKKKLYNTDLDLFKNINITGMRIIDLFDQDDIRDDNLTTRLVYGENQKKTFVILPFPDGSRV